MWGNAGGRSNEIYQYLAMRQPHALLPSGPALGGSVPSSASSTWADPLGFSIPSTASIRTRQRLEKMEPAAAPLPNKDDAVEQQE